jgi:alkanesulfonate monooxygenase SsuD/methylene tetrahydromethanopterin reductase-like flavin-dependent oxidoreductase (luciferase family)
MDPFVVLAAASQVTNSAPVLLVQQRDAIQTAKQVASIDQLSQGRFLFGVGGGWNQDELENHGTIYAPPSSARARIQRNFMARASCSGGTVP